jgi:hypothetical protein
MKNLIRRVFGALPQAVPTAGEAASDNYPLTIEDGSDNAMRRQLVQVLLRDLLRKHGIAPQWIELQMLVVSHSRRGTGLYVRLIVRHWDERLMNHASALQNTLMSNIVRFEPQASDWLHGISWQFEMTDSCPYTTLPDKAFWVETAKPPSKGGKPPAIPDVPPAPAFDPSIFGPSVFAPIPPAAADSEESEALEDLQRLFQVRDQVLGRLPDGLAVGYEKTQPLPL